MSSAARKARKRAGESIEREPKVGTPVLQRVMAPTNRAWKRRAGRLQIQLADVPPTPDEIKNAREGTL